ncbi:MAG: putative immunity protein [Candidatus Bathyarchaeia archaeon]|jgi:hypothetical protein
MRKYSTQDHKLLAAWAADCAQRVLALFETAYPQDNRPRKAIETCRTWVCTGEFKMATIRQASLAAHAAARQAKDHASACFAARAAGQAAAVAHVPQHAFGAAYYALKAVAAADPLHADANVANELQWQSQNVALHLKEEVLKRLTLHRGKRGVKVKIQKTGNF